jgi:hypothetical protein
VKNLRHRILKEVDLFRSRGVEIDSIRTVALVLGPYRNLTTLTASILFLHPHCQVLNHAGQRVFWDPRLDFFADYSEERFQHFLRYAVHISQGGERGNYGGSITLSHAFQDRERMQHVFDSSALPLIKDRIDCLFWKESQRVANHIREVRTDFDVLLSNDQRLRFLLPIRNPLDCAVSNSGKGYADLIPGVDRCSSVEKVLEAILDEFVWFRTLEKRFPGRFFHYYAYQADTETLAALANFLDLEVSDDWLERCMKVFDVKSKYEHSVDRISRYRQMVSDRFPADPEFADGLLTFLNL